MNGWKDHWQDVDTAGPEQNILWPATVWNIYWKPNIYSVGRRRGKHFSSGRKMALCVHLQCLQAKRVNIIIYDRKWYIITLRFIKCIEHFMLIFSDHAASYLIEYLQFSFFVLDCTYEKTIHSEKFTKFCKISPNYLTGST